MQISCRCAHCGHVYMSDGEEQIALEFDFSQEEVRFVCRNKGCKKQNVIRFASRRKTEPLPSTIVMRA